VVIFFDKLFCDDAGDCRSYNFWIACGGGGGVLFSVFGGNKGKFVEEIPLGRSEDSISPKVSVAPKDRSSRQSANKTAVSSKTSGKTIKADSDSVPNSNSNNSNSAPLQLNVATSCSQDNLSSPSRAILINEVAWAGTASDKTSREWIELKNNTGSKISLAGWQMLNKTASIKVFFDHADSIEAGGFYLLLRGSENFLPGVKADKFFSGAIKNSGESLRLFDEKCNLVDEVVAEAKWPAGTASPDYRTAERGADFSWHTYNGGGSGSIFGTPKAQNSLPPIVQLSAGSSGSSQASATPSPPPPPPSPPIYYSLNLFKSGDGVGIITSEPAGINCGESCLEDSEDFTASTTVTLAATPSANSIFNGWSGGCSGAGNCRILMANSVSVTATFNSIPPSSSSPPPSSSSSPTPSSSSPKIVINEILFNPMGSDAGKEFVELYNAGDFDIDLKNWSLRFMDDQSTSTNSLALIGSNANDITTAPSHKYFLIGLNGYTGTPPADVKRSASLLNSSRTIILVNKEGAVVDSVTYDGSIPEGSSWERVSPEVNEFRAQSSPSPSNSSNSSN